MFVDCLMANLQCSCERSMPLKLEPSTIKEKFLINWRLFCAFVFEFTATVGLTAIVLHRRLEVQVRVPSEIIERRNVVRKPVSVGVEIALNSEIRELREKARTADERDACSDRVLILVPDIKVPALGHSVPLYCEGVIYPGQVDNKSLRHVR